MTDKAIRPVLMTAGVVMFLLGWGLMVGAYDMIGVVSGVFSAGMGLFVYEFTRRYL